MIHDTHRSFLVGPDEGLLITGANGFIGTHLVEVLLESGFRNLRCLVRSTTNKTDGLFRVIERFPRAKVEIFEGNLKSQADAVKLAEGIRVVFHLAAGAEKSFPGTYLNTVVTTRNLLEAVRHSCLLARFVNISSLAVYSNRHLRRHELLDETCPLELEPLQREDPYAYAKLKQDELVLEYARTYNLPYVTLRPGAVYGPGKAELTGRLGTNTFGIFLQVAGRNRIPFTHVRNCAEAIALAGLTRGIDGQVFNVIDDDNPTGRQFMAGYRHHVGRKRYIPVPYWVFYAFCVLWEKYSRWSEGQLPPAFNRYRCAAYWKGNRYSNRKLKDLIGWTPAVSYADGSRAYYDYLRSQQSSSC